MKQNVTIILLAAVATLLLVNLVQDRFPPTAQAQSVVTPTQWNIACSNTECWAISSQGAATNVTRNWPLWTAMCAPDGPLTAQARNALCRKVTRGWDADFRLNP